MTSNQIMTTDELIARLLLLDFRLDANPVPDEIFGRRGAELMLLHPVAPSVVIYNDDTASLAELHGLYDEVLEYVNRELERLEWGRES